jgi:hypothetical protein
MNEYSLAQASSMLGQGQMSTAKAECPETEIEQILNKIKRIGMEVAESANTIESFLERAIGPRAEKQPSNGAGVRPVRSGQIGEIQDALDSVQNELARLRMARNSLASIA